VVSDPSAPSTPYGAPETSSSGPRRILLGELLVESKVITAEQLREVLDSPREAGKKLGQALLERGWITEAQLTQTLSLQLSVPWVSLYHIDFSRQLLNRVSREVAEKYCLIPIFVRHVKGQGETLYVAMDDPTNEGALHEVARLAGLPARPMIASASDIRSAIRVYYGEPTGGVPIIDVPAPPTRVDPPMTTREGKGAPTMQTGAIAPPPRSSPPPPPTPRRTASVPPAAPDASPKSVRAIPPPSSPSLEEGARRASTPRAEDSEPGRRRPRMVNLTLLDGTTISLPAKKKKESTPAQALTARDFVSALRATAHGADATEILGDTVRWEPVLAALLSILLRKGLIADWEFVEELRKI
jgi:type IV pilus assembly protein PilB